MIPIPFPPILLPLLAGAIALANRPAPLPPAPLPIPKG